MNDILNGGKILQEILERMWQVEIITGNRPQNVEVTPEQRDTLIWYARMALVARNEMQSGLKDEMVCGLKLTTNPNATEMKVW